MTMVDGASNYYSIGGGAAGVRAFSGNPSTAGGDGWVVIRWVAPPPLPPSPSRPNAGSSNGSDARSAEPVPAELSLAGSPGIACKPEGDVVMGAWVRLPSAAECTGMNRERTGSAVTLLGWATTPSFPVELAREHVDSSNAAFELRDDSGHITAVFIPAGGWTQMSGDTTLYPIWG